MTLDDSKRHIREALQRARERRNVEPEPPLQGAGSGGTSGGMEARLAKLEASMDYVKAELARLAGLPAESARLVERTSHIAERTGRIEAQVECLARLPEVVARLHERIEHLPTRAEMPTAIEATVDRAGARTQRTVTIVGGFVTIAIAIITYAPRLLAFLHQ
jgi:hypothetical protein